MVKILKQKYFPKVDFMTAKVTSSASYTWRSIISARDLVCKGARKLVGSGMSIDIWSDPWVPTLPSFKVLPSQIRHEEKPAVVGQLISNGEWDMEMLNTQFLPWEAEEILKIPIAKYCEEDSWTWHQSSNGIFSVRSAYYMELKSKSVNQATTSSDSDSNIVVQEALAKRGMSVDKMCPCCGEMDETLMHSLVQCEDTRIIWYVSPLRLDIPSNPALSFTDWNLFLFEKRTVEIEDIVQKAIGLVGEFAKANEKRGTRSNSEQILQNWSPPRPGMYKVNADAACFSEGGVGLGAVMRDWKGDVMVATYCKIKGRLCNSIEFSHVGRGGNRVAHKLANVSRDYDELRVWIEEFPPSVAADVAFDVT
ncbi:uncharacterized protein LOC110720538 [Chenopodium quinoa]|uniref:uncharacterized protein LOC110720538 n=1 Tax=Chenopodium quinoa TaxID=63459 RepID=UPI000B78E696|nr:uncharacterized protein LOC110720538 [Chenopodium quinoa]